MRTITPLTTMILAGAAFAALAGPVAAQTTIIERRPVIESPAPDVDDMDADDEDATGTVELAPEQDVIIRRRVIEERAAPVEIEIPRGQVVVGSPVPRDIPLRPMSNFGSSGLAHLGYFISPDSKIVVVEPQTRRVVRIIDRQG